jgi:hypothetical protein
LFVEYKEKKNQAKQISAQALNIKRKKKKKKK